MGELGGEILTPGSDTTLGGGALQWPLPVAGTITSPQGYRTDPITGETSYHSGTDIAVPEGTPILAAADGTVTIANALDSWGGSYGYHVKLDHGGGLTTLYAHCSSICVTGGQQVKAGQVIAYVGHTGRATGPHARQLPGLGLHAVEEVAVPGHRVVLADQLGEQRIVQRQAVGVQRVGFVVVGLFPGVEQICVLLTVMLQGHAVAIGEVAVVVFEPQQRLGFVELAVQKVTLGGHVRTLGSQISPHGAVGRGVGADWR